MLSAAALVEGLRLGDRHQGGIRCLVLRPFDPVRFGSLKTEIAQLIDVHRPSCPGRSGHVTHWAGPSGDVFQYSLWNRSGRTDDFSDDHELELPGKAFRLGGRFPIIGELAAALPDIVNMRVNVLGPGASLAAHEEHLFVRFASGRIAIRARFHVPVFTSPKATIVLDGDQFHLEEGLVHLVNHGCVHSAANNGSEPRVHLVWDMILTARSYAALFEVDALGPLCRAAPRKPSPVAHVEMGAFRRLPPQVPALEAEQARIISI